MSDKKHKPFKIYLLWALVLFQGLSGIIGGIGLVRDPTGRSLQIPLQWLESSPFENYLVPGLILLIVLGLYPLFIFYGLLKNKNWAWLATLILGIALMIWIGTEIWIIGYHPQPPLQLIYGFTGLIIIILVLLNQANKQGKK